MKRGKIRRKKGQKWENKHKNRNEIMQNHEEEEEEEEIRKKRK